MHYINFPTTWPVSFLLSRKIPGLFPIYPFFLFFMIILGSGCSDTDTDMPNKVRSLIFENSEFSKPITIRLPAEDRRMYNDIVSKGGVDKGWIPNVYINFGLREIDKKVLRYLKENKLAHVETIQLKNRNGVTDYDCLLYDDALKAHTPENSKLSNDFTVIVGSRKLKSIDYKNDYERDFFGTKVRTYAIRFSYAVIPSLPNLPAPSELYEGEAVVNLNPNTGKWELEKMELKPYEADALFEQITQLTKFDPKREIEIKNESRSDEKQTMESLKVGKNIYNEHCAACHQVNGRGVPGAFPALAGSQVVAGSVAELARVIVNGRPKTAMQAYGASIQNEEIAALIAYLRSRFGNIEPELRVIRKQVGLLNPKNLGKVKVAREARNPEIHKAILKGEVSEVGRLLANGADPNMKDVYGKPTLMNALERTHISVAARLVRILLDHGANVNSQDPAGNTALVHAVIFGRGGVDREERINTIHLLLERGADPNMRNNRGKTALMLAKEDNNTVYADILRGAGGGRSARDK